MFSIVDRANFPCHNIILKKEKQNIYLPFEKGFFMPWSIRMIIYFKKKINMNMKLRQQFLNVFFLYRCFFFLGKISKLISLERVSKVLLTQKQKNLSLISFKYYPKKPNNCKEFMLKKTLIDLFLQDVKMKSSRV